MRALEIVAEQLRRDVEREIFSVGILARVFGRGKTELSIKRKIGKSPGKYSPQGRLMQDGVGIRVAVYFADDVSIAEDILRARYEVIPEASSVDVLDESTFSVIRRNLVFRMPSDCRDELSRGGVFLYPLDGTFEVQFRSMLSEGWHEVEHDLRYKCKDHWDGFSDLNRALNGVFATLETSEWSMLKIFDDLALRHYKAGKWAAMAHARLRVRATPEINDELIAYFDENRDIPKAFFRADRSFLIYKLFESRIRLPVNLNNYIYLWNHVVRRDPSISLMAPESVRDALSEID